ncbi:hypothetical protein BGW42_008091 [Actinomortierella wolfii]|nr:hypothetical protein BGW42_008091 [Actinomortierella wolfii]
MSKRSSTPAKIQEHRQKSQRLNNGGAESQNGPQIESSDISSATDTSSSVVNTSAQLHHTLGDVPLEKKLAIEIFGDRPAKHEFHAVEYVLNLKESSVLIPTVDDYLAYQQAAYPNASKAGVARAWCRLKEYFSNVDETGCLFESLSNVASLVAAFKEAPMIPTKPATITAEPATATATTISRTAMLPPPRPASRSSRTPSSRTRASSVSGASSSSSGSSNSNGSNGNPTPGQILSMKNLFRENFDSFHGAPWSLPSGAVLDDRLRSIVEDLSYESALHSFVIEDVDAVLKLFDDPADHDEIERILVKRSDEGLPTLSPAEHNFLKQYVLPPDDLHEFLADHAWRHVGNILQEKPSEEFQIVAHDCVTHVLRTYQENDLAFPTHPSESWFTFHLWGFLRIALSCRRTLAYQPGEVASEASSRRRNKRRIRDGRQCTGHKVDGMVVASARSLEICYMEAAKKDGGINTTKSLNNTRKLCKLMKDGHDAIRERAIPNIREQLVTFGVRISGPSVTIFTLHQRPGRFYQAVEEVTQWFPPLWSDQSDTQAVIAVITWILRLRKAILAMAVSVKAWLTEVDENPNDHQDWIAPTMTSPCLLSTPVASSDIPPLAI